MTTTVRVVPNGLVTDPSRIVAGDGGLIVANNVVCRSPGLVEPRPSLRQTRDATMNTEDGIFSNGRFVSEWDGEYVYAATDGDELTAVGRSETRLIDIEDGNDYMLRCEQTQARQMWMFRNSLRMLDRADQDPSETTDPLDPLFGQGAFQRLPGAPRVCVQLCEPTAAGIGYYALDADETAAYRAVVVRYITDAIGNRVPIFGPPSDRMVVRNTALSEIGVHIKCIVTGMVRDGDEVRLYRSPANGVAAADPGDELVFLRVMPAVDIVSEIWGDWFFTECIDGNLPGTFGGDSLYTNDSQEGPTRANYRLRYANDLAAFQDKMFYAGGSPGWRQTVTCKHIGDVPQNDKSETLCSYESAAIVDWTSGSDAMTGTPAYAQVGQLVTEVTQRPDDPNPTGLYGFITEINGNNFTIDRPAPSDGLNQRVIVWDWIAFEDDDGGLLRIYAPYLDATTLELVGGPPAGASAVMRVRPAAGTAPSLVSGAVEQAFTTYQTDQLAYDKVWRRMYSTTPVTGVADYSSNIAITIEYDASFGSGENPDQVAIRTKPRCVITSSKPFAFTTRLGLSYGESTVLANRDGNVARVWWSKANQPECVPLLNFTELGDISEPVVRIFATTDRIWVLKTDGLWMGYGSGDLPESMTWQVVDATFRMCPTASTEELRSDALPAAVQTWAAKCRDTVYAWTLRGVVAIGTAGVARVDEAIAKQIRSYTPTINPDNRPYDYDGQRFCSASPRDGIVAFGGTTSDIPTLDGVDESPRAFLFALNVDAGTWATWSMSHIYWPTGCGESERGLLLFGSPFGWMSAMEWPSYDSIDVQLGSTLRPFYFDSIIPAAQNRYVTSVLSVSGRNVQLNGVSVADRPPIGSLILVSGQEFLVTGWEPYDLPPVNPVIIVDREGMPTGDMQDVGLPWVSTMTFSANQVPVTEKHFLDHYLGFQRIRGGTEYKIQWRGRQQTTDTNESTVVYDSPESPNYPKTLQYDVEHDQCMSTPREASRVDGLETTVVFAQAGVYWALDSFALSYDQETRITTPNARRR